MIKIEGQLKVILVPRIDNFTEIAHPLAYKVLQNQLQTTFFSPIILVGQSEKSIFDGAALDNQKSWETPLGSIDLYQINSFPPFRLLPQIHARETFLKNQLPFIQTVYDHYYATTAMGRSPFTILPILTGDIDPQRLAFALEKIIETCDRRSRTLTIVTKPILLVVSDIDDKNFLNAVLENNFELKQLPIPILTLMHLAKNNHWKAKLLNRQNPSQIAFYL